MTGLTAFFPTCDLAACRRFYTGALGLSLRQEGEGQFIVDTGRGCLGFVDYGDGRPLAQGVCLSFDCADRAEVDAVYARLQAAGLPTLGEGPCHYPRFPVYSFFLKDPNGYTLEFQKIDGE